MPEKLERCYERLQRLEIVPKLENLEILLQTLYEIREVYQELKRKETESGESG